MTNKRITGKLGESVASEYLVSRGYRIMYRNYRYGRYGEIDLIAEIADTICFVEVKSRSGDRYGAPAEAVGFTKRKKILTVAGHFIKTTGVKECKLRFDVIEVYLENDASKEGPDAVKKIRHIENAFDATFN